MANHSGIIDSGTYFEIVPNTRKITVPQMYKVIGTVGDHLSEQLTFRCPKLIDGHDIEACARHYITWKNVNEEVGHDALTLKDTDDEYLYFTWSIRDGLSVAMGLVSFSIHFEDLDENGKICYRWNTAICNECEILDSINAVLSTYEAVYVSGDMLVFADYTPVDNKTLPLETNGLVPKGTINITTNGTHDVGEYAEATVNVVGDPNLTSENIKKGVNILGVEGTYDPKIDLNIEESGFIWAHNADTNSGLVEHTLSADDDPDFIPENIKEGVTIFGVEGTYAQFNTCTVLIENVTPLAGVDFVVTYLASPTTPTDSVEHKVINVGMGSELLKVATPSVLTISTKNNDGAGCQMELYTNNDGVSADVSANNKTKVFALSGSGSVHIRIREIKYTVEQ